MSRVLVIESSARQRGSVSRLLTAEFISTGKSRIPLIASRSATWRASRCRTSMNYCWEPDHPCDGHSAAERRALERSIA